VTSSVSPLAPGESAGHAASKARRPRVAAIIDTRIVSGPGRQLAALARALSERHEAEVLVVTLQRRGTGESPYVAHLAERGVKNVVIPETGPLDLRVVERVGAVLREWRPDVVQTHSYKATVIATILRAVGAPWKWVGFWHGATTEDLKVRVYHLLDRTLLLRADRVVVVSSAQLALFRSRSSSVSVMHNAVIPDKGGAVTPIAAAPWPDCQHDGAGPLIGVIGRLSSEKGVDVFLRACSLLRDRGVSFSAVLVGEGPDRPQLEALRDSLGLGDSVRFLGSITNVAAVYQRIDLLVIPSRSEGLPNVLLEAISAGRPVVATRVGAIPEVVDDPLVGSLVAPGSPEALASAIAATLSSAPDPAAAASRERVADRYSLDRRVEAHVALYDSVLAG
jgi:glycosyltransferase involved in cell wall biosynthesis